MRPKEVSDGQVKDLHAAIGRLGRTLLLLCSVVGVAAGASAEVFDQTIPAAPGTRLDVRLYGGAVVVRGWSRDEVRVRATHFRTDTIDLRVVGQAITVRAHTRVGAPHAIDVDIDVPTWMAVAIVGTYVDISVTGTRASVAAATVRGDVTVTGGVGTISLKTIEGEVVLEGGEGRADLSGVNNGVRVTGLHGDLFAETVNGNVKLQGVQSTSVEVGTIGGDVSWDGPMISQGHYQFATHDGDIDVTLPPTDNAAVSVRAFEGQFRSTFPVKLPEESARHKRFGFVLGTGMARLDLESFRGTISLRQASSDR